MVFILLFVTLPWSGECPALLAGPWRQIPPLTFVPPPQHAAEMSEPPGILLHAYVASGILKFLLLLPCWTVSAKDAHWMRRSPSGAGAPMRASRVKIDSEAVSRAALALAACRQSRERLSQTWWLLVTTKQKSPKRCHGLRNRIPSA